MIEFPESATLARQLNGSVRGLQIAEAQAGAAPHGFAFYSGSPETYAGALKGRTVREARAFGGILEMYLGGLNLLFNDGANLRLHPPGGGVPKKHQLLLRLEDGSAITCTVQMYAGIHLCGEKEYHSDYHRAAHEKPSPLSEGFSEAYFLAMASGCGKLSAKAFMATEQRIPGLGNGVLQDILFLARVNPRTKVSALSFEALHSLYRETRETLREMTEQGGRDTEKDLYGQPGGYATLMSRNALDKPCPACGGTVVRESYMGGNVYYCPACQPAVKN